MQRLLISPRVLCTCVFFAMTVLSPVSAKKQALVIGEIHSIDIDQQIGTIAIYHRQDLDLLQGMGKIVVFDKDLEIIARFHLRRRQVSNNSLLLHGTFERQPEHALYMGRKVGFLRDSVGRPSLPDRVYRRQEKRHEIVNQKDRALMVFIPEGPFVLGKGNRASQGQSYYITPAQRARTRVEKEEFKKRVHYLSLPGYYIDKFEITNGQFENFLNETGRPGPPGFSFGLAASEPVEAVSYEQARQYCQWANKRLPTELEWEKAARGSGLKRFVTANETYTYQNQAVDYPVGREFDSRRCNTRESNRGRVLSIDELNDDSVYGVKGMCGNVAEWTDSWYLPYRGNSYQVMRRYNKQAKNLFGRRFKVIRGGAYYLERQWARSYERMAGGVPNLKEDFRAGFRCAKDQS